MVVVILRGDYRLKYEGESHVEVKSSDVAMLWPSLPRNPPIRPAEREMARSSLQHLVSLREKS